MQPFWYKELGRVLDEAMYIMIIIKQFFIADTVHIFAS